MVRLSTMFLIVAFLCLSTEAAAMKTGTRTGANPIRRIVTMLQLMQKKVETESKKQKELFEKFMCYCDSTGDALKKSVEDLNGKIPQLESAIKEGVSAKAQLEAELKDHKKTRKEANKVVEESTAMREKENKAFNDDAAESNSNIDALGKAIPAIEKGMGPDFLQTDDGQVLKQVALQAVSKLSSDDRELLTSFLSMKSKAKYAPTSGEILGILKQMKEGMEGDLEEITDEENSAKAAFDELMAAKEKEISSATAAIEEKTARVGVLAVEIVEDKHDYETSKESLAEDSNTLAALSKECAAKTKEYEALKKTQQMEMSALADTIKVLNDDDALDLFKKTVPSASAASLLQIDGPSAEDVKDDALQVLADARREHPRSLHLDFITLALRHKASGFGKVLKMIDDMVALLKKEGKDDESKKEYCESQLDKNEDSMKVSQYTVDDLTAKIKDANESLDTTNDELKNLEAGIAALDKSVVVATEQRKDENAEFTEVSASSNAAIQLVELAKNRMNKFYNPKMYKAPPKRELSEEERITLNMGGTLAPTAPPGGIAGTGITAMTQEDDEPVSFLQTHAGVFSLAYRKQAEASNGVIAMMDMMINDIKTEMNELKMEEDDSQEEYEQMMANAKMKRTQDTKTVTEKQRVKADLEESLQKHTDTKKAESDDLIALKSYNADLHGECDWLLQNFDTRREARTDEIEALQKAQAVLKGGAAALMQVRSTTYRIRGAAVQIRPPA